jgi:copper chaperone CopZ
MKIEEIIVANIKCGGCASTIKKELEKLKGVSNAEVIPEKDMVKVSYDESIERNAIVEKLLSLGYPEATEKNGMLLQLKSYTSCMIGKVNNLTHSNN